jgi:hypothetical protein
MKRNSILSIVLLMVIQLQAQVEPEAGNWKTWFITSGKDYRLPAPSSYKNEIHEVLERQKNLDAKTKQQIHFLECRVTRLPLAGNDE